jgi:hypothetical protein
MTTAKVSAKEILLEKLKRQDSERPRSTQVYVGPSEIGGCQRRMWYRINGVAKTNNDTLNLAANMGTAIHTMIESAFAGDERYLIESKFVKDDLVGHVDLIDTETKTVWDWKTTTKSGLSYFPSAAQREQVQLYGYLANANGVQIDFVGLVAIARDGSEEDIVEHYEPYNEEMALAALARYHSVKEQFEPPAPEKDADFCAKYCPYFGECTGIVNRSGKEIIENVELIGLIEDYRATQEVIKKANAQLDFVKSMLDGTTGTTPSGITVKWSQVSGRQTTDEAEVQKLLGFVPKKQGAGYSRLTVK